jgi:twitching motility protein PilU
MSTMERILRLMAERKASDIYLSAHSPALIRINGNCLPINAQVLPPEAPLSLLAEVVHQSRIAELERTGELSTWRSSWRAPATSASVRCASAAAMRWWCGTSR